MKKLLLVVAGFGLLIFLVAGYHLLRPKTLAPVTAQAAETPSAVWGTHKTNGHDELADVLKACGPPVSEDHALPRTLREQGITGQRTLRYLHVDLIFMKDAKDAWSMTGAFPKHGDDAMSKDEVAVLMPCIADLRFSNELFDLSG